MKLLQIYIFLPLVLILSQTTCLAAKSTENALEQDTTLTEGTITFKAGYFPYLRTQESGGYAATFTNNGDFARFFDFGYYASVYVLKKDKPGNVYVLGGINYAHRFYFLETYATIRMGLCISFYIYPFPTTVFELDFPLIKFDSLAIISAVSHGWWFGSTTPLTFSIGISF